jgi:Protein of unknown function (DUF998)
MSHTTRSDRTTKALLIGGALAGPLFTSAWIIEGALTAHYDPLRHPISALSLGEFGWMQVANFSISGLLICRLRNGVKSCSVLGLGLGALLIGLAGIGLIGAAIFALDPANGYPPNTPPIIPTERTPHGILHDFFGSCSRGYRCRRLRTRSRTARRCFGSRPPGFPTGRRLRSASYAPMRAARPAAQRHAYWPRSVHLRSAPPARDRSTPFGGRHSPR